MKVFISWIVLAFALITLATVDTASMSDGTSTLGFPQTFYSYTGGKTIDGSYETFGFIPVAFMIDLGFATVVGVLITVLSRYFKRIKA